jgi:hypothetical protein
MDLLQGLEINFFWTDIQNPAPSCQGDFTTSRNAGWQPDTVRAPLVRERFSDGTNKVQAGGRFLGKEEGRCVANRVLKREAVRLRKT